MEDIKNKVRDYFKHLEFNADSHTYGIRDRALSSVSSLLKNYTEPFDAEKIAGFVALKRSREEGILITKQDILQEWEDKKNAACDKGNLVHNFGENYIPGVQASQGPLEGYERAIINFWDSIPDYIEPFLFELKMFSEELGIAGTTDIILYNKLTGKFIIADYKTNIDLFKNYKNKKMLKPFNFLLDSPYNKYQLQLSLYQLLFEQCGFEVESRKIIWLKPNGEFEIFNTTDYNSLLIHELKK